MLTEIHALADLVLALRNAVTDGDRDKVTLVSSDISGTIAYAMARAKLANRFLTDMYFYLLLTSSILIMLAGFVIRFLYKMITSSNMREEEGSAFSRAVLVAQEKERGRISRELHDTVAQDINYLCMEMNRIVGIEEKDEREKLYAETAVFRLRLGQRVRNICSNLAPPDLESQGLGDALRQLCLDFCKRSGIECRMEIAENIFLDGEKQLQLFRIVQEALTNVRKHAHATEAIVKLCSNADGSLSVSISDNGVGIKREPQKASPGNSPSARTRLGIRGMSERATLLGGTLSVGKQQGRGTLVHLHVAPTPPNTDKTKVLLIDDHSLVNSATTSLLEGTGRFRVLGKAHSLEEARLFVEKTAGEMPEIIILDIQMGEENGLNFFPFLNDFCGKKRIPKPPVLVCSTFNDSSRIQTALKLGASGYLPKTLDGDSLLNAIDAVLRGEIYVPDERIGESPDKYGELTRQELNIIHLVKLNKSNPQIA